MKRWEPVWHGIGTPVALIVHLALIYCTMTYISNSLSAVRARAADPDKALVEPITISDEDAVICDDDSKFVISNAGLGRTCNLGVESLADGR